MTKQEQAQYLVNLHILMQAQTVTSPWLAEEYGRNWDELKGTLKKEKEDEARKSEQQHVRAEDQNEALRNLPGGGQPAR